MYEHTPIPQDEVIGYEDLVYYAKLLARQSEGKTKDQLRASQQIQETASEVQASINLFKKNGGTLETVRQILQDAQINFTLESGDTSTNSVVSTGRTNETPDQKKETPLEQVSINYELTGTSTYSELQVEATVAQQAAEMSQVPSNVVKRLSGQEAIGTVVRLGDQEYIVKESLYEAAFGAAYYDGQVQGQERLISAGITQLAPVTKVEINGRPYLVQRFLNGRPTENPHIVDQLKLHGIKIRDIKGNAVLYPGTDNQIRPVLIDFSLVANT